MRTLKRGMRGPDVKILTQDLVELGYLDKSVASFNSTVHVAVMDFQARHLDPRGRPLVSDGIVGALTWAAISHSGESPCKPFDRQPIVVPVGESERGRAALSIGLQEFQAGAVEIGANNSGKWVEGYLNGLAPAPANWCAAFVSYCFDKSGEMPFNYSLGARDIRNQFKRKGWTYELADEEPSPGDICFWWRGRPKGWQGHIGLVWKVEDGILYTLEGNKGRFPARVNIFDYVLSRVPKLLGFGRVS